jgi:hypothetical protein
VGELDELRRIAGGSDAKAAAAAIHSLAQAADTSRETLEVLVGALASDATYLTETDWSYYHQNDVQHQQHLWEVAAVALAALGEPAVEAVVAAIEHGSHVLLRARALGPRIVALAKELVLRGDAPDACDAAVVIGDHVDELDADEALALYMAGFDRSVPHFSQGHQYAAMWPRFSTPPFRAALAARWANGSLRPWIEARLAGSAMSVSYLVALLAAVPDRGAVELLRSALTATKSDPSAIWTLKPLAFIDVDRARRVFDGDPPADPALRSWGHAIALRAARGQRLWDPVGRDRPYDMAIVAAFTSSAEVFEALMADIDRRGVDANKAHALVAHVRAEPKRFDRAANALIRIKLDARPGLSALDEALQVLAEADPARMSALMAARQP